MRRWIVTKVDTNGKYLPPVEIEAIDPPVDEYTVNCVELVMLPIGTRIRFLQTLTEAPTGDHPALLYAEKGEGGEVTGHGCSEGHWVKTDKYKTAFGAVLNFEFEEVK